MPLVKFDIKKDNTYPCFCLGCLVGKRQDEMSEDTRYCQNCFDFLSEEAKLIGLRRPAWIPKKNALQAKMGQGKPIHSPEDTHKENPIKSTSNEKPARVDIIQASTPKRGRKKRELPDELIKQLQGKDMGSKAIATKLKERGIDVSYKTIQRVLSGKRR